MIKALKEDGYLLPIITCGAFAAFGVIGFLSPLAAYLIMAFLGGVLTKACWDSSDLSGRAYAYMLIFWGIIIILVLCLRSLWRML